MTYEEAISRHSKEYFYWKGASIRNDVMWAYPELNHRTWALFSYFAQFLDSGTMTYIEYAGERYYYINYAQAVSRLWIMGITTTQRVSELFRDMCGLGDKYIEGKPYFFKQRNVHDIEKGILTYFCPTPLFYRARDTSGITISTEEDKAPIVSEEVLPEQKEPEVLSDTLFDFYKLLMQNTSAFKHQRPPTNEKPAKLWLNTDRYIKQLMDGTFYEKNKDKFDKKAEDKGAIPKLTLSQIVELCKSVKVYSANGKPSIENVFMQWDGKVYKSPILNYIWASLPPELPKYTAEQIAKLKTKYPNLYEQVTESSLRVAKIEKDDPYMYLLYDKMMDYFDDDALVRMGKFSGRTPTKRDLTYLPYWCIMAYNSYRDKAKKNPKWTTFEDWMREFKVDDRRTYTPWFWMLYWIRKNSNGKYMLTEDSQVRSEIEKRIAKPYGNGQED